MIFIWIFLILALRFFTLIPSVIDDDEAFYSASGAALHHPLEFYQRAIDNHPPGTAWFYFFVQKLTQHLSAPIADPRLGRAVLIVLLGITAWILGEIASDLSGTSIKKRARFLTAIIFFMASALPSPKNLSVTNEGLMLPLLVIAIGIWLQAVVKNRRIKITEQLISGLLLVFAILVKQTAVFFALPIFICAQILISRKIMRFKESFIWILAALVFLIVVVQGMGAADFIYWNFTYPSEVLLKVRQDLFSSKQDLLVNTAIFAIVLWPLLLAPIRNMIPRPIAAVLWAWIAAGVMAVLLGSGVFFHYYLLILPPLCIFAGAKFARAVRPSTFRFGWLGIFYTASCVLASIPLVGLFWGNDLFYYERLAAKIRTLTKPSQEIFVWGGNPTALALSQRNSSIKFVNSRFAAPPYVTPKLETEFQNDFLARPPYLFVDLHERGDNLFRLPTRIYPWLAQEVALHYSKVADPSLPWAKLYVRKTNPDELKLSPLDFTALNEKLIHVFTLQTQALWSVAQKNALEIRASDQMLKAWMSLETFCQNEVCDSKEALDLYSDLTQAITVRVNSVEKGEKFSIDSYSQQVFAARVTALYQHHHYEAPLALTHPVWWASYAIVKLQPAIEEPAFH